MNRVVELSHNEKLRAYVTMQCIKEGSTLRVSPKKQKPCPRVVYHDGKQDGQICAFLLKRKEIWNIMRKMETLPFPQLESCQERV